MRLDEVKATKGIAQVLVARQRCIYNQPKLFGILPTAQPISRIPTLVNPETVSAFASRHGDNMIFNFIGRVD